MLMVSDEPLSSAVLPQALVGLLKHNVIPMSWENLSTLSERCRDPAVSVKKKALQCVGELLAVSLIQQLCDTVHLSAEHRKSTDKALLLQKLTICMLITCPNNLVTRQSFSAIHI